MGVNLVLMSLTTPVHLLTPQSANGFGGAQRAIVTQGQCVNTPRSAQIPLRAATALLTAQKLCFLARGCSWFVREGVTGGVKYLGWEISLLSAMERR